MDFKRRNRVSAEFNLASMTDMILLLLIFFMITSSAIQQNAIEVKLPKASATEQSVQDAVSITVTEEGKYFSDNKEIPKEQLESYLVNALKGKQNPSFTIRADENTRHKDVVFAMNIAENHQYGLAIATVQKSN